MSVKLSSVATRTRSSQPSIQPGETTPTRNLLSGADEEDSNDDLEISEIQQLKESLATATTKSSAAKAKRPSSSLSTTGGSVASASSSTKENDEPPTSKRKSTKSINNRLVMSYPVKKGRKRRPSGTNPPSAFRGAGRGRRPSGASSTVSAASNSHTKVVEETGKSDVEEDGDDLDKDREEDVNSDNSDDNQGEGVFVVERIDDKQVVEGTTFYKIKWKGWKESANTWEPIENLEGCPGLVEEFEKRYAERKILAPKRRITGTKRRKASVDDDDDEDAMLDKTKNIMHCYTVVDEWPADKEPISVEGVINVDGHLTYVVKRKTRMPSPSLDRTNGLLVRGDKFKILFPQLVIQFYQSRISWAVNSRDQDEDAKAQVAAELALLRKNRGSKIGKKIAEEVDKEVAKGYKNGGPSQKTNEMDLETQIIDLNLDENEDSEDDAVMDVDDDDVASVLQGWGTRSPQRRTDKFGLPENVDDENTSCSSNNSDDGDDQEKISAVVAGSRPAVGY